ncbi:hypothetical protein EYF80_018682 [Liparis tanakae]|uniref:Uncharacterized protein n=1 Tax=Liparis tanakae TaxID=230148 RepID=A0A4Z2I1Q8_9TELE|nr:hypothetical protein EYF80_018682 [Liparis tanakae]
MRIKNLLSKCKAVEEKCQEQIDRSERLELENQVLVQKQQNHESEIQELTDEIEILEEVCLDFKKNKRGCFGRKMQDRDTELDKMKNKIELLWVNRCIAYIVLSSLRAAGCRLRPRSAPAPDSRLQLRAEPELRTLGCSLSGQDIAASEPFGFWTLASPPDRWITMDEETRDVASASSGPRRLEGASNN